MARSIQSPGVEIKEIDQSLRPVLPVGTNVLVAGFADKGPTDEVIQVTSQSEFEQIYGVPTTPAERYFYHSVRPLFNSPATIQTYRLPYGSDTGAGFGNKYGVLAYPASAININNGPYYLYGTSDSGGTNGQTGFFYPLYLTEALAEQADLANGGSGGAHTHTFSQFSGVTFYMPDSDMNHAQGSAPSVNYDLYTKSYGSGLPTYGDQSNGNLFLVGKPTHLELTQDQYNDILQRNTFQWYNSGASHGTINSFDDLGNAAMLVVNKAQTTIDEKYQGFYVGALDNTNLNPATDFDGIVTTESVNASATSLRNYTTLPEARLNFSLSSISDNNTSTFGQDEDSVSEIMENLSPFAIDTADFDDTVSLGIFRLRQTPFTPDTIKLAFNLSESYVGSFDYHRQINNREGGAPDSFYIDTREDASPNVMVLTNDFVAHKSGRTYLNESGDPTNKVRFTSGKFASTSRTLLNIETLSSSFGAQTLSQAETLSGVIQNTTSNLGQADSLFPVGSFADADPKNKNLGSIPRKLDRLFDSVENVDLFDIDLTVDGGLTTINAVSEYLERGGEGKYFDDTVAVSAMDGFSTSNILNITDEAKNFRADWKTVFDRFAEFAEKKRKDHMFIADLPRPIFVQGKSFLTLDDPNKNFSQNILNPIKAHTAITNTSYATTYAQWVRVYDSYLDDQFYSPFSGFAAAMMANTDSNFQPWFAPAGFTRGLVTGVNDLALYPKQRQRDFLYKESVNPVAFFPGEGFVVFGQKTLLKKPSAFDRINVRRLFLNLEKGTRVTVKFFLFEPNTLLTRTRVINTLNPIFENAKNTEGLYDYLLVCDERNNTPEVIDQNELVVDIYLKPVRAAEFILVNFYATRTGTDFNELVG